jgi:hypothetical protein
VSTPYFTLPGTLQGRIQPTAVQATDGTWLMVLGVDKQVLPHFHLDIGDMLIVEQALAITGHQLLRFDWRMRYSPDMPAYAKVLDSGIASFYAPVSAAAAPTAVRLEPITAPPTFDIFFDVTSIGAAVGDTVSIVHNASGVRREGVVFFDTDVGPPGGEFGANAVAASDLMGQSDPPSITAGDYTIAKLDSGMVRPIVSGTVSGDRLTGVSIDGAAPFRPEHADQLANISGATIGGNNGTDLRLSSVPEGQGDVSTFDLLGPGSIPAGRVALIENGSAVRDLADTGVTVEVLGALWRAKAEVDIGAGFVTRAELVEHLVQADPDGFQRATMAMHVSKIAANSAIRFTLALESVTA